MHQLSLFCMMLNCLIRVLPGLCQTRQPTRIDSLKNSVLSAKDPETQTGNILKLAQAYPPLLDDSIFALVPRLRQSSSFGLRLVHLLVEQLNGHSSVSQVGNLKIFSIRFS